MPVYQRVERDEEDITDSNLSYDDSEDGELERLPWLELLSASQKGEKLRQAARELTREYTCLHEGAMRYHAMQHRACIKEELEEASAKLDRVCSEGEKRVLLEDIQELLEEEKRVRALAEEPKMNAASAVDAELEQLLGRLKAAKISSAVTAHQGEASILSRYNSWVTTLNQMTPMAFVQTATVLTAEDGQENLHRFINSLCMELDWHSVKNRFGHLMETGRWDPVASSPWKRQMGQDFQLLGYDRGCSIPSEIYKCSDQEGFTKEHRAQWAAASRRLSFLQQSRLWHMQTTVRNKLVFGETCAVFSAAFCATPAVQLLSASDFELTLVLKTLVDMGHFSYSFVTPVGRAILELACERSSYLRWTHALKDFLYVLILVFMGHALRESSLKDKPPCPRWTLYMFLFLALLVAFNFVGKMLIEAFLFVATAGSPRITGIAASINKHATTWNVLVGAAELFSIWVSVKFIWKGISWQTNDNLTDSINSSFDFFRENPATMSSLVLIRWTIFSTSFLQLEQVGRNMVPVVIAVTQPASMYFLFFLGFMIMAAFHAYYVYPIEENVGHKAVWVDNYVLNTFLKIFRLTVLGDFDLAELEGLDDKIHAKLNRTNHAISGSVDVDSADWGDQYHRAVRYQFVILSLVITVVVMNVYIGLLGELYQEAERRSRQLYFHYRASCAYRHMCERSAFTWCFCCRSIWKTPVHKTSGLYWFIYKKRDLADPDDGDQQQEGGAQGLP